MANQTQLSPGSVLQGGKYKIEAVLGQGGFGITYLGIQTGLKRKVAIKEFFIKEYCNRDSNTSHVSVGTEGSRDLVDKFRIKFIKEAQMIAGLNHPNIIKIYDVFEEHGTAYYVMEYHNGGSLSSYVSDRGRLSEKEAIGFIRQVGSALSYIHARNINHLDVKPGNIVLDSEGRAVLIDFGMSKHYDESGKQTNSIPIGISHGYAPIEQYMVGGVGLFSPQTDIYSLGATLYKLLTGQTPPNAEMVDNDGLPDLAVNVSATVKNAIEYAMQPRRKDRPQSVDAFLSLLDTPVEGVKDDESTTFNETDVEATVIDSSVKPKPVTPPSHPSPNPVPPAPKPSKKWLIPVLILVGILFGVGIIWWLIQGQPEDISGKLSIKTVPESVEVILDGQSVGVTPLQNLEVSQGSHTLELKKEGYESVNESITIGKEALSISKTLQVLPKPIPTKPVAESTKTTKLYVTTTPSGATVSIDGKKIGSSPINGKEVSNGSHTIKISLSGYEDYVVTKIFSGDPVIVNESLKSKPAPVLTAVSSSSISSNKINGYEYVDLGLSVKWATKNVGASSPSDYGDYYAWGETSTKAKYTGPNSLTYEKTMSDISGNPNYDVARKKWGSSWRLPTESELEELESKCTWKWMTEGGHNGYRVIGPNGKSIFLPAAGCRYGSSLDDPGEYGHYWSSTPNESRTQRAYILFFTSYYRTVSWRHRYIGFSVRPVSE